MKLAYTKDVRAVTGDGFSEFKPPIFDFWRPRLCSQQHDGPRSPFCDCERPFKAVGEHTLRRIVVIGWKNRDDRIWIHLEDAKEWGHNGWAGAPVPRLHDRLRNPVGEVVNVIVPVCLHDRIKDLIWTYASFCPLPRLL